jgi:hypothetical protein
MTVEPTVDTVEVNVQVYRVVVKKSEGGYNMVRPEAWVNYAVSERVRLISAGCVEFINSRGDRIPIRDAIRDLARLAE